MNFSELLTRKFGFSKELFQFFLFKGIGEALYYLLPLVIAVFMTPAEFGSFSLSQMVVIIIVTIFITSLHSPFVVSAIQEKKECGRINKNFTILVSVFFVSVVCWFFGILFFQETIMKFTGLSGNHVLFMSFFYLSLSIKRSFEILLLGLDKKTSSARYTFLVGTLNIIIILVFSQFLGLSVSLVFFSYFVSSVIAIIPLLSEIDKNMIFPLKFDIVQFRETFEWVRWQIFGLLAIYLIDWGDNLVLKLYVPMDSIGVYNVAYQLFKGVAGMTLILNMYFLPYLSRYADNKEKIDNYMFSVRHKIMIIGLCGVVLAFFLSPMFYGLFYSVEYIAATDVFRVLVLAFVPQMYMMLLVPFYNSVKRYKFIQIVSIIQIVLNIVLDFFFVEQYGIIGAAYGTLASGLFSSFLYFMYHRYRITPVYFSGK